MTLRIVLWIIIALLAFIAAVALWVYIQFRRYRREVPQPQYKQPKYRVKVNELRDDALSMSWIGHSTLYIRWNGIGILTDPVFSERTGVQLGPWTVGPKRHTAPAADWKDLVGKVDLILLSHAHMDHFDMPSLRKLAHPGVEVVTASGTSKLLRRLRYKSVHELGGTDALKTQTGIKVTAVPVRHWGARFPWNKDYGWTGYLLEYQGRRIFFAGDTAYVSTFTSLRAHGGIDIVCMPIGAYSPDSFQRSHCTPEQAWDMFLDTGGRYLVPMHWDTFVLSQEPVQEPMERLLRAAGDQAERIVIRHHGETFSLSGEEASVQDNLPAGR